MAVIFQSREVLRQEDVQGVQSLQELLELLEAVTEVPLARIKLISAGKLLTAASFSPEVLSSKIMMTGSSETLPSPVETSFRVKDDLSAAGLQLKKERALKDSIFDRRLRAKSELSNPYRFHDLETLSGFDDESRARDILYELSTDPGVLAVLKKHKWSVGKLCEMYPEGYVGVSDVCVLGLNKNKGEAIYLRLRTDDLKGFRKLLTIKEVLYHELAHNEHSDHNDDFYMLMRQIEREVVELDWRKSTKGHLLGSSKAFDSDHTELFKSESNDLCNGIENKQSNCCTEDVGIMSPQTTAKPVEGHDNDPSDLESRKLGEGNSSNLISAGRHVSSSGSKTDVESNVSNIVTNSCIGENNLDDLENSTHDNGVLIHMISDRTINAIDDCLASFHALQQQPPERIIQLRQAIYEMLVTVGNLDRFKNEVKNRSISQLLEALTLLRDVIERAKDSKDPKHRSLNRTKKLFQRVLLQTSALPVLFAAGFEEQAQQPDYIILARNDPVILYMTIDILNKTIEAAEAALVEYTEFQI